MGICYLHGRYEDTTAPGCPKCAVGAQPVYMGGIVRHPDMEPDAPPPCPECARLRAELEEARKKHEAFSDAVEGKLDSIEPKVTLALASTDQLAAALREARKERDAALSSLKSAEEEAGRLRDILIEARSAVEDDARTCEEHKMTGLAACRRATLARIDSALKEPRHG